MLAIERCWPVILEKEMLDPSNCQETHPCWSKGIKKVTTKFPILISLLITVGRREKKKISAVWRSETNLAIQFIAGESRTIM